jgi:hypothetical protein
MVRDTNGFLEQQKHDYKAWFMVWFTQLNLAIQNAGFLPENGNWFADDTMFPRVPLFRHITRIPPSLQRVTGRSPLVLWAMNLNVYFQRAEHAAAAGVVRVEE